MITFFANKNNQSISIYLLSICALILFSCEREKVKPSIEAAPTDIIQKLKKAGFSTTKGVASFKGGYVVEGDMYFTKEQINDLVQPVSPKGGRVEHYRSKTLVNSPATISIYMGDEFGPYTSAYLDVAIARFNEVDLGLKFERGDFGTANIIFEGLFLGENHSPAISTSPYEGKAGYAIYLNKYYFNDYTESADGATLIAHEIGHAIGFLHSDNAETSNCNGEEVYEAQGSLIPFTPSESTAGSWMLPCRNYTDRPFTAWDKRALRIVYPKTGGTLHTQKIHKFYNIESSDCFLTGDSAAAASSGKGYEYRGVAFNTYTLPMPGTVALYRYYDAATVDHRYHTQDISGLIYEGNIGYVYPTQPVGSYDAVPGTVPVIEKYNKLNRSYDYGINLPPGFPSSFFRNQIAFYAPFWQ